MARRAEPNVCQMQLFGMTVKSGWNDENSPGNSTCLIYYTSGSMKYKWVWTEHQDCSVRLTSVLTMTAVICQTTVCCCFFFQYWCFTFLRGWAWLYCSLQRKGRKISACNSELRNQFRAFSVIYGLLWKTCNVWCFWLWAYFLDMWLKKARRFDICPPAHITRNLVTLCSKRK